MQYQSFVKLNQCHMQWEKNRYRVGEMEPVKGCPNRSSSNMTDRKQNLGEIMNDITFSITIWPISHSKDRIFDVMLVGRCFQFRFKSSLETGTVAWRLWVASCRKYAIMGHSHFTNNSHRNQTIKIWINNSDGEWQSHTQQTQKEHCVTRKELLAAVTLFEALPALPFAMSVTFTLCSCFAMNSQY